ncbi:MAG: hypothetical protein C0594_17465 [Marinilabiliales bacterium]|nr:MAG: hypothetical protein C0594_17465 [Marinilabiliales bacterium]
MHQSKAYIAALLAAIFWSLSFIWYKQAFIGFGPATVIFIRFSVSSVLLLSISFIIKKLQKIDKKDILAFLLLSLFQPFLYFLAEGYGMDHTSSTTGSVIISTIPIFSTIAALMFFNEKLSKINLTGIVISFTGVMLVVKSSGSTAEDTMLGVFLLFGAVFSAVIYSLILKKLSAKYNPITIVSIQNTIASFMFLPLFLIFDLSHFQIAGKQESIIAIIELSVFGSTLAFLLFTFSIKYIGIARTTVFTNLIPIFTTISALIILSEKPDIWKISGIVVVLLGLFLSQTKRWPIKRKTIKT